MGRRPDGQCRVLALADRLRDGAAGAEPAAAGNAQRARRVSADRGCVPVGGERHPRDGRQQALRVRVAGIGEQRLGGRDLDDPAEVHDGDPVAQVPDHGQVVRDQQQRQPQLGAQVLEQVQNRRLHADVERGDRLVGDQQLRLESECAGDGDSLALPAGELARVGVHCLFGEADEPEQLPGVRLDLGRRHDVVHPQQFVQHAADGEPRVERRVRVLEDHLDLALVRARPAARQQLAVEPDVAPVRPLQPGQGPGQRRLARARLAHQRECLAALDREVDAVDRAQDVLLVPHPRDDR